MFIFFYFYLLFIYILNKKIILKFKELFNVDKTQNENSNNKNKFIYSDLYYYLLYAMISIEMPNQLI